MKLRIAGPFHRRATDLSPAVDESVPGIRLAVSEPTVEGDSLHFTVHLAYGFKDPFFTAFRDIYRATALTVQDMQTGDAAVAAARDPEINDFEPIIENFTPPPDADPVAFMRTWAKFPVTCDKPSSQYGVAVQASIQGFSSNLSIVGETGDE